MNNEQQQQTIIVKEQDNLFTTATDVVAKLDGWQLVLTIVVVTALVGAAFVLGKKYVGGGE